MYDVGVTTSLLMETDVVEALLYAWSIAVPVATVPVVSCVIVQVVLTVTGPVTGSPPGAVPPEPNVPTAVQPLVVMPDSTSVQPNVIGTSLRYQPLFPSGAGTLATIVGGVLSTRTGP